MGKIIDRQRARASRQTTDWKDSRLVIAALAVAGTATFMSTVVLPITTASLTAKLEALEPADKKIKALETELKESKRALVSARAIAAEAIQKTPFLPGSPYPVGIDKIVVGSSPQQVIETYPSGRWREDDYYSVELDHKIFYRVTYYFSGEKRNRHVSMVLFQLRTDSPLNMEAIKNRFVILFGSPLAVDKYGRTLWKATSRDTVEIDADTSYTVHLNPYLPIWANKKFGNPK